MQFYRGLLLEKQGVNDIWHVKVKGISYSGNIVELKSAIDWWRETGTLSYLSALGRKQEMNTPRFVSIKVEGVKIMNDNFGKDNHWYCLYRGVLMKGSQEKLASHIRKQKGLRTAQC